MEQENGAFLDRKTIFSFVFPGNFVTYAVGYSLPTYNSIFTPYFIDIPIFENKKNQ